MPLIFDRTHDDLIGGSTGKVGEIRIREKKNRQSFSVVPNKLDAVGSSLLKSESSRRKERERLPESVI